MKERIIKTYESFDVKSFLNSLKFESKIDKSKLIENSDGTFDYKGYLDFSNMGLNSLLEIPFKFRHVYDGF